MKSWSSLLMLMAACGIIHPSANARAFEFAQGVIVDALHSVVYMSNSQARIDAIRVSNGEVIATSPRGAKPLLLYDDVLLVEAHDRSNALRLAGLKTKDLEQKFELGVPLPSRAGPGSFYVGARVDGNEIIVRWRSIRRPISAIPTREPADVTAGFARIDPATGRLIAALEGEPPVPPAARSEIPAAVQKLADDGRLASQLCPVDNLVAALQYVEENGERHLILRRWFKNTDESMPAVSLLDGELTFRNFSRDCRHLLASKEMDGWVWHIYSTITGKHVAEIHNPLPGPEFFVSGDNLIYQSPAAAQPISGRLRIDPPRLVALDLSSGKELWARPIGEAAYIGPYPPNPSNGAGRKWAQVSPRKSSVGEGSLLSASPEPL